ncbi:hypothetical protein ABW21_db0206726 [Orbilia brochopaga]|nr:hypothetical protein ABW21_db0206726 [Drechslerella brochopaga]
MKPSSLILWQIYVYCTVSVGIRHGLETVTYDLHPGSPRELGLSAEVIIIVNRTTNNHPTKVLHPPNSKIGYFSTGVIEIQIDIIFCSSFEVLFKCWRLVVQCDIAPTVLLHHLALSV